MDMGSTGVKFSGGKIVLHSVLRVGTTSGNPWQRLKHRDIFIGTWKVRTLYSSGALEILTWEVVQSPLDVVASQEVDGQEKAVRNQEVLHYSMGVQRDLNSERVFLV